MAFERRILTTYDASTAGFDRGTRRVEQQLARLTRTADDRLGRLDQRFERAGRAALRLGAALGALGVGLGVAQIRTYAETWRNVERSLTSAGFAIEGNREKLARLAIRTRQDFAATGQAVARFARITGDDVETSIRRVETLQKLLAVGGAAPTEAASATLQLTQGLRAGQLGGEELRAIREAAPVEFLDALAARAGGTRAELKQLGADAKLTADVITGALDDLAATADQRFAQLSVSGSEAAEILSTGFATFFGRIDEQLGATQGINSFLAEIGQFLAEDAQAAATFAKALEVLAVSAVALAGGKGFGAVNKALTEGGAIRRAAVAEAQSLVAATKSQVVATQAEVASKQASVQAARLRVATIQREIAQEIAATGALRNRAASNRALGVATAALAKAEAGAATAGTALTAAQGRAAVATNALTIAQGRLILTTRLAAATMATLRGALAFFGGVPGLIFAAAAAVAFYTISLRDAKDETADLASVTSGLESKVSSLEEAQRSYSGAIEATARGQNAATSSIVADTKREFEAKRSLLELEVKRAKAAQALAAAQRAAIERELADTQARISSLPTVEAEGAAIVGGGFGQGEADAARERLSAQSDALRDNLKQLQADAELTAIAIERAEAAINSSFTDTGGGKPPSGEGGAARAAPIKETTAAVDDLSTSTDGLSASTDGLSASTDGLTDSFDAQADAAERSRQAVLQITDAISSAILQAKSFEDALKNVAIALLNIAIQQLSTPGGGFLGSLFAKGAAFSGGNVVPFATGGIVKKPTIFPMARGLGLMGEAGPEAILPLTRTASGNLGVEAVVPQNIGSGWRPSNITIEGSKIILQGSSATPEEFKRTLEENNRKLVRQIIRLNENDPSIFYT